MVTKNGVKIIMVMVWTSLRRIFARFTHRCQRPSRRRRRRRLVLGRRGGRQGHAVEAETEKRSHRRARHSIREYELTWLLQQRLRAVSWPRWSLRCLQPLHGHGMGEFSDLDDSHAATPQRVTRASCAQLLRSVLGAACRLFA